VEYCDRCGVAGDTAWFEEIKKYEKEVLAKR
jgi:L-rhamnose isomerase